MEKDNLPTPGSVEAYLRSLPRRIRWRLWLSGRRYLTTRFLDRTAPLVVVAHSFQDASRAAQLALAIEQDWFLAPAASREAYEEILCRAPGLVIVQLRRKNLCGCLGHRHMLVSELPFVVAHEAFRGAGTGEMDIAYDRIGTWAALPISDGALDARFLAGSRLEEFHAEQFRLRTTRKGYYALVRGRPPEARGRIELPRARDPPNPQRFRAAPSGGRVGC